MIHSSSPSTKLFYILLRELRHGWVSALGILLIVASLTGVLTFLRLGSAGLEREMKRRVRDLGSNVVILPASTDKRAYHLSGTYEETISEDIVDRLLAKRASLNHLIPMLERNAKVNYQRQSVEARVVGLTASIPVPGRPKSPMRKAIEPKHVQLGSSVASHLQITRKMLTEADSPIAIQISEQPFPVQRINRATGTWQDSAVFMSLECAQSLFDAVGRISRIEAVECTSEKCALTGQSSFGDIEI